jgi:phage terminase large subunit
MIVSAQFPEKLQQLFKPARYKIVYGGRGKGASWGISRRLLLRGASEKRRIICAREFQNSIDDSVHALLSEQIHNLGLHNFYDVKKTEIIGRNGTLFTFHGLKHNIKSIKSLEGADDCWVTEAQTVSKMSWDTLIPTIRKTGSEIYIDFNPELEEDETYQRFVVLPPTDSIVIRMSWRDNPWFNEVLEQERKDCLVRDPSGYQNIWDGLCKKAVEGAVFAKQLSDAEAAEPCRLTRVPYNPAKPVSTFWDLGLFDATAIWFVQRIGFEWRVIDYLESSQQTLGWYIQELQKRPYIYDTDWLPHDGRHKTLAANGKSLEQQARELGRKINIIPLLPIEAQINTARTIFPNVWFDRERCADGIHALRHYQYKVLEGGQFSKEPMHNWASHGASAFMGFAVSAQDKTSRSKPPSATRAVYTGQSAAWMGA